MSSAMNECVWEFWAWLSKTWVKLGVGTLCDALSFVSGVTEQRQPRNSEIPSTSAFVWPMVGPKNLLISNLADCLHQTDFPPGTSDLLSTRLKPHTDSYTPSLSPCLSVNQQRFACSSVFFLALMQDLAHSHLQYSTLTLFLSAAGSLTLWWLCLIQPGPYIFLLCVPKW